jgi:hypothetical protein
VKATVGILVAALSGAAVTAAAQLTERPLADGALAHPAIGYYALPTSDPVAELKTRLDAGAVQLTFDETTGYLRAVLGALHVPVESQMLVMSKTGVQGLHTGPANPRAIYFNDTVTVGYIHGAPLLELAVHDPQQGVVFYTIDQKPQARVVIDRPRSCLRCHQVYSTLHVPGMLARSVFIAPDGLPLGQFGSYDADDRTPFRRRWGGWYVSGTHGDMRHMGNAIVADRDRPEAMISERTLNRTSLAGLFDARAYLSPHSDIAALMVFQHQSHMTNLITRIGWEARIAADERRLDVEGSPMRDVVNELVDYLLFVHEEPLTSPIEGTSGFAEKFSAAGPFDGRGRSLRQLDLERRLLKYPCSYMIYSPAFGALPAEVRQAIYRRMREVFSTRDSGALTEILADTLPDFSSSRALSRGLP